MRIMANCPKCGKTKIRRRKGKVACMRCGPFGIQYQPNEKDKDYGYSSSKN